MKKKPQDDGSHVSFEKQLDKVGGFGVYQKVFMMLSVSVFTLCLVLNLSTVFTLEERPFFCEVNGSRVDAGENSGFNDVCSCPGTIVFDLTNDEPTLVVKYRLICENEIHRHWARFAWAFGLLCSSQINGYMADRFGRRSQICLCSVVLLVFGIVGPMMPNYLLYALCRFIASWGVSGYIVVCYVYLAESMDNRGRAYLGVVAMMAWSSGGSAMAFFGKFFRHFLVFDWVSAISFAAIGFIISLCAVESPRWRYTQGDDYKFYKDMMFIAKVNGRRLTEEDKRVIVTCPKAALVKLKSANDSSSSSSSAAARLCDLFVNKYTTCTSVLLWYVWLSISFICYSMVFHALVGDKILNFLIASVLEVSLNLLLLAIIQRSRRKIILLLLISVSYLGALGACAINILALQSEYQLAYFSLTIACRLFAGVFWGILGLVTNECYPTVLRAQAHGVANMIARISICAVTVMGMVPQKILVAIVTVALTVVIVAINLLPETHGKDLPTTIEEFTTFCNRESLRIKPTRAKKRKRTLDDDLVYVTEQL